MTFWSGSGSGSADPCLWLMDPDSDSDPDPGSGSCFFRHWPSRCQLKNNFCLNIFSAYYCLKVHLHNFPKIKSQKESQNSRNHGFSYYFCMMTEGSGSGSIPLTWGSGSGRPKNMWIRIRVRIRNTENNFFKPSRWICRKYTFLLLLFTDEPVEPAPGAGSAGACVYHQQVMAQHGRPTRPLPLRHHTISLTRQTYQILLILVTGCRPMPAVSDFTRDGRWSTYHVSVLK